MNKKDLTLINAHTHAAMVAFRALAEDLPLSEWHQKHIFPAEKKQLNPAFIKKHSLLAIKEMQKNGIRAFCDMYYFQEATAQAAKALKMTAVLGEALLDVPGPSARNFETGIKITRQLIKKYKDDPFVVPSVAPHSIYLVCEKNLIRSKELAHRHELIWQIHLAETKKEVDDCKKQHGLTPVAYLDRLGLLDQRSLLFHCVWLTEKDIDIIQKRKAKVVHCPLSNLKLGSGVAPVSPMLEKGVTVALGTDGAASSNRLDVWEAAKYAALIQKGYFHDPTKIPAETALEMMTINGVKALGLEGRPGFSLTEIRAKNQQLIKQHQHHQLYQLSIDEL